MPRPLVRILIDSAKVQLCAPIPLHGRQLFAGLDFCSQEFASLLSPNPPFFPRRGSMVYDPSLLGTPQGFRSPSASPFPSAERFSLRVNAYVPFPGSFAYISPLGPSGPFGFFFWCLSFPLFAQSLQKKDGAAISSFSLWTFQTGLDPHPPLQLFFAVRSPSYFFSVFRAGRAFDLKLLLFFPTKVIFPARLLSFP